MAFDLGGFGSGVGSIFSGIGSMQAGKAEAAGFAASAKSLREAARLTKISTSLKLMQTEREVYKVVGGSRADAAANGVALSGSALDVIKSSAQQGGLQKAVVGLQGRIEYTSLIGQAEQAEAQAKAAKKSGKGSGIGSIVGGAASVAMAFSDDRLKEQVTLIHRREDGIGIYTFRYLNDGQFYLGVLANEVLGIKPDAVWVDDYGYKHVDYEMIQADMRCLGPNFDDAAGKRTVN